MIAIASSAALGSRCWSALRFTGKCHRCERYDRCTHPARVANETYDQTRAEAARLRKESDELYARLKEI